jgi:MFS family permease
MARALFIFWKQVYSKANKNDGLRIVLGGMSMELTPAKEPKVTIWNRNFVCVFLANAALSLAHSSINTLVSTYAEYLGAGALLIGLLTGLFFGVSLAMRPVTGPVSTKVDKQTLMIFVFILGAVVNIGYALFPQIGMFVFFRFFHGVQYSLVGSLIMTVAGDSLPREKLASGMGVYSLGGIVMFAVGPAIGKLLLDLGTTLRDQAFGFRLTFIFAAFASLLAVIPSALLKLEKQTKAERAGTGAWYKNIVAVPTIPTAVVITLVCAAYSLYNGYMIPYAAQKGIAGASAFFTVSAIFTFFSRPLSGKLTDRFGVKKIVIPCLAVFAASFVIVGLSKSLPALLVGAALAATGYGAAQPSLQAMSIQTVLPARRAVAANTYYAGLDLGLFIGPFLGSVVFHFFNYSTMYLTAVVPIVTAAVLFLVFWPGYTKRLKELRALEKNAEV